MNIELNNEERGVLLYALFKQKKSISKMLKIYTKKDNNELTNSLRLGYEEELTVCNKLYKQLQ